MLCRTSRVAQVGFVALLSPCACCCWGRGVCGGGGRDPGQILGPLLGGPPTVIRVSRLAGVLRPVRLDWRAAGGHPPSTVPGRISSVWGRRVRVTPELAAVEST